MIPFKFIEDVSDMQSPNSLIVFVDPDVSDKSSLFEDFSLKLQFPEYFGFNWDAFLDCMTDLQWIAESRVVIIHDRIPHLPNGDIKIYLGILKDAVERSWDIKAPLVEVLFLKSDEFFLRSLWNEVI